jgi:hypothetical protein
MHVLASVWDTSSLRLRPGEMLFTQGYNDLTQICTVFVSFLSFPPSSSPDF